MLTNLNARQRAMLLFLIGRDGPIPANQLASRFGASLRSIRYDLDSIRTALKGTGLHLDAKPRAGIWLEGARERRDAVSALLASSDQVGVLTPQEREGRILETLLTQDGTISLRALSDDLGCSRTTLLRDLPRVEQQLKTYGLRLTRVRGSLRVVGSERDRREALVRHLIDTMSPTDKAEIVGAPGSRQLTRDIAEFRFPCTWEGLAQRIETAEHALGRKFTDESFVSLIVHLAVALQRLSEGQSIAMPAARLADLKQQGEWRVAAEMATQIAAVTGIQMPEAEIGYLTLHLLGSRSLALNLPDEGAANAEPDSHLTGLVDRFIRRAGEMLQTDLSGEVVLRDGLLWHFRGLLTRQRYRVKTVNPLKAEIRQQMARVYFVVARIAEELRPELSDELTDDEIGFLTIHLAAALERNGRPPETRVLVVCSTGLGSAQLLAARLLRVFKEIHIVGVVSALESADTNWQTQTDLVVTTVPIPALPVPQVRVSPLLTAEEAERVRKAMGGLPVGSGMPERKLAPIPAETTHLLSLIARYAEIKDAASLRGALDEYLSDQRAPVELAEPILREVALLGIRVEPAVQIGLAIHLQMALPRLRAGQVNHEPDVDRFRQEHRSLFKAVERGLQLFGRWHGVTVPEAEVVPVMRYIMEPSKGDA